jgi:hypothetical protein
MSSTKSLKSTKINDVIVQSDLENHPNNLFEHKFTDRISKYKCIILRQPQLGYQADVCVPTSHPLYSKDTDDKKINVHGFDGLRFEDGKFPIDFFHEGDYILGKSKTHNNKYWTFDDVKAEVIELARQLYELR